MTEICMHCGRSVAWGSGNYVSRVPDASLMATQKKSGKKWVWHTRKETLAA